MRSYDQYCALARALDHVGHRWTLLIVRELLLGPKRFTDLQNGLPGIANNLLADRLRHLRADGLVRQRELPPPAASTVYELTDAGRELRDVVDALIRWGGRWMLSGPGEDRFRTEWLTLALDALGVATRMNTDTIIQLTVDGETIHLTAVDGHLATQDTTEQPPDLCVTADPPTILGLAAGALPPSRALEQATILPDTPEATQMFIDIFSPPTRNPT